MKPLRTDSPGILFALIAVQSACAAFFLWDAVEDALILGMVPYTDFHLVIEMLATLTLIAAVIFETRYLMALLRRKAHLEDQVSIAAGAFHDIITTHFHRWGLSPAESDVAMFAVKGLSITEIAGLRGSAEGTVKSQLNAVYRKAGVAGRPALLGLLIEDLMGTPLIGAETEAERTLPKSCADMAETS